MGWNKVILRPVKLLAGCFHLTQLIFILEMNNWFDANEETLAQ
jgi:hypothetical protein